MLHQQYYLPQIRNYTAKHSYVLPKLNCTLKAFSKRSFYIKVSGKTAGIFATISGCMYAGGYLNIACNAVNEAIAAVPCEIELV